MSDSAVPAGLEPGTDPSDEWSPDSLERLATRLTDGGAELAALPADELREAWDTALEKLLDRSSSTRRDLDSRLASASRLSEPALDAALDAMLVGFAGVPARRLIERGEDLRQGSPRRLALAVLAGNVPGLAVQVVLPALAARRPLLVKSSSREPFFAASLVRCLAAAHPVIAGALAAVSWPGGQHRLEDPILDAADPVVVYGHAATLADLDSRCSGRLIGLGPKLSIAVVSADADAASSGRALARDVALFEQRGCLSVQTVFTDDDPTALVNGLRDGLAELAERWPPVDIEPQKAALIQQLRQAAELRGAPPADLPLRSGTVLLESRATRAGSAGIEPGPGARTVRVQPVEQLDQVALLLEPWHNSVQGAALAGAAAWQLSPTLGKLGVTRMARPGELQYADALWANGEEHLLDSLSR